MAVVLLAVATAGCASIEEDSNLDAPGATLGNALEAVVRPAAGNVSFDMIAVCASQDDTANCWGPSIHLDGRSFT